jgi:hypothetical protein
MARMVELAALSSSNTTSHHVHGVEDRIGLYFWAKAGDLESDEDDKEDEGMEQEEDSSSVHTMDTVEFIERSKEYGYTMAELLRADDEVQVKDRRRRSEGVNESQSKFLEGTRPISQNQPYTHLF